MEEKALENGSADKKRARIAISVSTAIAIGLTLWGVYGFHSYGLAVFILVPFCMGLNSTLIYGYKQEITFKEARKLAFITLGIYLVGLFFFAIEGLICILMTLPLAFPIAYLGALLGFVILKKSRKNAPKTLLFFLLMFPTLSFIEKDQQGELTAVRTSIIIQASPSIVWKNVIEFPELKEPSEFIFKTGIAYPINARITGNGVGAIRYCNFTTGSFVEPVTVWDENKLLKFDVLEQPAPMKEISFWDINAPHLHDYFVSKEGQFKLTELENGTTLLEGTTWYYHNIKPAFYWQIWSNHIVHKIHERVLNHIKTNAEKQALTS